MTGVMAQCISEKNPYHSELYRDSHALATRVLQGITNNIEITNHGIYENIYKMNKLDFYNLYSGQKVQLNGDKCELYNGEIDIKSDDAWYKLDDLYGVLRDNENTNFVVQKITDDKIYLTHENGSGSIYTYKELYPDFNVGDIVKRVNGKYIK